MRKKKLLFANMIQYIEIQIRLILHVSIVALLARGVMYESINLNTTTLTADRLASQLETASPPNIYILI